MAVAGNFQCESCGKSFRWKPELAGKRAKCKCGEVMTCPSKMPIDEEADDGLMELAPAPMPARSIARTVISTPANASAVMPVAGATSVPRPILSYRAEKAAVDKIFPNPVMDLWAPIWVFGIGIGIEIFLLSIGRYALKSRATVPYAAGFLTAFMIFRMVILSAGMYLAAKVRHINLGRFVASILKLLAISIAPSAAMDLCGLVTRFIPLGFLGNWLIGFVVYFALIGTFFDLDQEDTWYCVKVLFVLNIFIVLGVIGIVAYVAAHR
jgi:hypothetical protein